MTYLIEPYNAHQKPPRKRHWMEIVEEEALVRRMAIESEVREQTLRQAIHEEAIRQHLILREQSAIKISQNLALPQQATPPSSQQVQDGQYAQNAGGGGWVLPQVEEESEFAAFSYTPTNGPAPLRVYFTNLTPTPENDTFFWTFGSGSLTSNIASPGSRLYTATGSYTVTLRATSSVGAMSFVSETVNVVVPTLIAGFVFNSSSYGADASYEPMTASLVANNIYNSTGTQTNNWYFLTGSTVVSQSLGANTFTSIFGTPGTYTASLQVTESIYNVKSVKNQIFIVNT